MNCLANQFNLLIGQMQMDYKKIYLLVANIYYFCDKKKLIM